MCIYPPAVRRAAPSAARTSACAAGCGRRGCTSFGVVARRPARRARSPHQRQLGNGTALTGRPRSQHSSASRQRHIRPHRMPRSAVRAGMSDVGPQAPWREGGGRNGEGSSRELPRAERRQAACLSCIWYTAARAGFAGSSTLKLRPTADGASLRGTTSSPGPGHPAARVESDCTLHLNGQHNSASRRPLWASSLCLSPPARRLPDAARLCACGRPLGGAEQRQRQRRRCGRRCCTATRSAQPSIVGVVWPRAASRCPLRLERRQRLARSRTGVFVQGRCSSGASCALQQAHRERPAGRG